MQSISSPIEGIESETEKNKEHDEIEQRYLNKKSAIMNEFEKFFLFLQGQILGKP